MMWRATGGTAPAAPVLDDEWFGEDSAFHSGEELAAALLAMARVGPGEPLPAEAPVEPLAEGTLAAAEALTEAPLAARPETDGDGGGAGAEEFQVAAMPSFSPLADIGRSGGGSGWRGVTVPEPRAQRSGWSIRQSVQTLRMTEEILRRLREDAAQLAWELASMACAEVEG